jgi:hypothetical protein
MAPSTGRSLSTVWALGDSWSEPAAIPPTVHIGTEASAIDERVAGPGNTAPRVCRRTTTYQKLDLAAVGVIIICESSYPRDVLCDN